MMNNIFYWVIVMVIQLTICFIGVTACTLVSSASPIIIAIAIAVVVGMGLFRLGDIKSEYGG